MIQISKNISSNLKALRKEKGWSLDKASLETGVSKAMLGQIEREESSPTIATLWKIANGFHIPFSAFLEKPKKALRSKASEKMSSVDKKFQVFSLFPFDKQTQCEIFLIQLLPGYEHFSDPHEKGVIEHVLVLEGTLEVLLNDAWQKLQKGQVLRFDAHQPHGYRNTSATVASFHNVIHYLSL